MKARVVFCFMILLVVTGLVQSSFAASSLPVIRIGVVYDGPIPPHGWGKIFRSKLFPKELLELTRGEFDVRFPPKKQVRGDWTVGGVKKAVDFLLADPSVDLVLALGIIASHEVSVRPHLPKPAVAPFVIDEKLQGLPFRDGTSGVPNLNYLSSPSRFVNDVKAFRDLVPFTKMTVLVDQVLLEALPGLGNKAKREAGERGVTITIVPVGTSIQPTLAALPQDTDVVFVTPLLRLPIKEFQGLVAGLIDRRLPSFSMFGRPEVEQGLFATISPRTDTFRLARRVALNIHRILLGEDAGTLPVTFAEREQLIINMATARAIDTWPSFRVLTEAELLHEDQKEIPRRISLYSVMREALSTNLDLASADRKVAAGLGAVGNARANLLPQVNIGNRAIMIDADQANASFGNNPEQAVFATGNFRQLIYSDDAWANYTVQQRNQDSRVAERREVQLNTARDAGVAYLNVLRTKTVERIQKENLRLTRSNLELARVREAVGSAARDEVYRWESEIANGRIDVLNAQAERQQAGVALNRILYRPLEEPFVTNEAGLDDPLLFADNERLFFYINNPRNFQVFRNFEVNEGIRLAPEIHRLDALIAAQDRTLLNAERTFWAPEVALSSEVSQRYAQGGAGQGNIVAPGGLDLGVLQQDRTIFAVELGVTFPLFAGGSKAATQLEAGETLRQLRLDREASVGRIEERIRSALFQAGASAPTIRLSREAAESAQKNLELVIDQYSRGAVDIIKLLNSQNAALTANLNAANAVYNFIIDIIDIQRAVGQFDYFVYAEERARWYKRLEAYFAKAGINPEKEIVRGPFE